MGIEFSMDEYYEGIEFLQQTLRSVDFDYRQASDGLLKEIISLIRLGEPVAILGPLASGKQSILTRITETEADSGAIVASVRCEAYCDQPDEFLRKIAQVVRRHLDGNTDMHGAKSWDEEIEQILRHESRRLTLLLSNLDSLPTQTARIVLKSLRRLKHLGAQSLGILSVVFTGSYDLAPLVYGIESEFPISRQFVLQGFDQKWFKQFLENYAQATGYEISDGACQQMFTVTGGEILLLRLMIDTFIDCRRSSLCNSPVRWIGIDEVEQTIGQIQSRISVFSSAFYRAFARVASSSVGLKILEQLFQDSRSEIPQPKKSVEGFNARSCHTPTEIELCGIARRVSDRLVWSSPLIQVLARQYFSRWTIGDCYACLGDWSAASTRYQAAIRDRVPLTLTPNQRPHLSIAIKTFAIELTRLATDQTRTIDDIRSFFCDYFRCLTGMENVTIWRFDKNWEQISISSDMGHPSLQELEALRIRHALRNPESMEVGRAEQTNFEGVGISFRLQRGFSAKTECIVASNYRSESTVSPSQRDHFHFLCGQFSIAYHNRLELEKQSRQAEINRKLLSALPNLLQIINRADHRSESALRATADNLRSTDLRRVMFALVDEVSAEIQGVVDSRIDGEPDIACLTKYSLKVAQGADGNPIYEDVQQKCVLEKRTLIISDAASEPLVKKTLRKIARLKALVLVPIQHENRVLGTMHIECLDCQLPSSEYIIAIEGFCENLGKILQTMTWFDGLQQVATKEPDSVTLWDLDLNLQFANQHASSQLKVDEGWQVQPRSMTEILPKDTLDLVQRVQQGSLGEKRMFPDQAMIQEVRPIRDWRDVVYGLSVRTQSVRSQMQLMEAFREFSQCRTLDELARAILARMKKAGHAWARIYQAIDTKQLLGIGQYGLPAGSAGEAEFAAKQIVLTRGTDRHAFWQALEQKRPMVYTFDPTRPFGDKFTTTTGLSVMNVKDFGVPPSLAKNHGDAWIELPLYCERRSNALLGKITVDCSIGFPRESLLDLEILSVAASEAWAVILDREDREVELSAARRQEMLRAMGETMHQLQSRIASLWTWIDTIKNGVSTQALVISLTSRLHEIDETISKAKSKLRPLSCSPTSTDLYRLFVTEFRKLLGDDHFRICAEPTRFTADVDVDLLTEVVEELALNSRKAVAGTEKSLQVSVTLEAFSRLGNPWARVIYRDNGPGIAPAIAELIFKEFYTNWSSQRTLESSGLGLPHLRSILAVHSGQIVTQPAADGACFIMEFPSNLLERYPYYFDAPEGIGER